MIDQTKLAAAVAAPDLVSAFSIGGDEGADAWLNAQGMTAEVQGTPKAVKVKGGFFSVKPRDPALLALEKFAPRAFACLHREEASAWSMAIRAGCERAGIPTPSQWGADAGDSLKSHIKLFANNTATEVVEHLNKCVDGYIKAMTAFQALRTKQTESAAILSKVANAEWKRYEAPGAIRGLLVPVAV